MAVQDIAIVGFSFKLPQGAEDEVKLWDILIHQRNLMTEWPESRYGGQHLYDDGPKPYCKVLMINILLVCRLLTSYDDYSSTAGVLTSSLEIPQPSMHASSRCPRQKHQQVRLSREINMHTLR